MKQCNVCLVDKEDSEFGIKKLASGNYTLRHLCKSCLKTRDAQKYASESKEDRDKRIQKRKQWRDNNRDKVLALKKKYRVKSKIIKLASIPNDQHVKAYEIYKTKYLMRKCDAHVRQRETYIRKTIYNRLKRGVQRGMRNSGNKNGWANFLSYNAKDLIHHLEKQFINGMSWSNLNEWHIDHIIPIASFNLSAANDDQFKACYSLHNLRPVWAKDNMDKYYNVDKMMITNKKGTGSNNLSCG